MNNLIVPIKNRDSIVSLILNENLLYPSLLKVYTAFGPHSISPFVILVKWTPRNGNSGFGTG